jgi:glycerol uptake facilitator-like aquaporin
MVLSAKLVGEFLGTFVFLFAILQSGLYQIGSSPAIQPFVIVIGLLVAIFMFGSISGGHFNPAVSVMLALRGDEQVNTGIKLISVILAQVLGGMSAFYVRNMLVK